jgi:AbrB family looped-hinge helix DNA binding protein
MKAKVAERGQVTIPKLIRDRLGIRPGTVLEFCEKSGKMIVSKMEEMDVVDKVYGTLGRGRRSDDIIRELRGSL